MSPHIPIVRSALVFVARQDGRTSAAMLAANAACIIAVLVLLNLWTLVAFATAISPRIQGTIERIASPVTFVLFMILLWAAAYALVRREATQIANARVNVSPRIVVIYAVVSLLAWAISMVVLATQVG